MQKIKCPITTLFRKKGHFQVVLDAAKQTLALCLSTLATIAPAHATSSRAEKACYQPNRAPSVISEICSAVPAPKETPSRSLETFSPPGQPCTQRPKAAAHIPAHLELRCVDQHAARSTPSTLIDPMPKSLVELVYYRFCRTQVSREYIAKQFSQFTLASPPSTHSYRLMIAYKSRSPSLPQPQSPMQWWAEDVVGFHIYSIAQLVRATHHHLVCTLPGASVGAAMLMGAIKAEAPSLATLEVGQSNMPPTFFFEQSTKANEILQKQDSLHIRTCKTLLDVEIEHRQNLEISSYLKQAICEYYRERLAALEVWHGAAANAEAQVERARQKDDESQRALETTHRSSAALAHAAPLPTKTPSRTCRCCNWLKKRLRPNQQTSPTPAAPEERLKEAQRSHAAASAQAERASGEALEARVLADRAQEAFHDCENRIGPVGLYRLLGFVYRDEVSQGPDVGGEGLYEYGWEQSKAPTPYWQKRESEKRFFPVGMPPLLSD